MKMAKPTGMKSDPAAMERYMKGNADPQGQQAYEQATGGGKASQQEAGYQPPENGPFACSNCTHFDGQQSCEIVQGNIDPDGCCNQFSTASAQQQGDATDQTVSTPPPAVGGQGGPTGV